MRQDESIKKDAKHGFYAEWDEEFEMYSVFGSETGFCYGQHYVKEVAEEHAEKLMEQTEKYRAS